MKLRAVLTFSILSIIFGYLTAQSITVKEFDQNVKNCIKQTKSQNPLNKILHISECLEKGYFHELYLSDIYNKIISLNQFDNIILINYWFIGCEPCVKEKQFIIALEKQYPKIKVISVGRNSADDIKEYIFKSKLPKWIYIPNYEIQPIFNNIFGYPLTILINPDGKIMKFIPGGIQSEKIYLEVANFLKMYTFK
jgi:thiol-disulfide isomerase/thioredoxin